MTKIEILRPGTFTAMSGETVSYSAADMAAIATSYDPKVYEAPLVIGHPKVDAPAYGWVKALEFADGKLRATVDKIADAARDLIRNGAYRRVSASLFKPGSANSPAPGAWYLCHVGLLGAAAPAIKGLQPVELSSDADVLTIEFGERIDLAEENDRLKAQLVAHAHLAHGSFLDGLIREGRFLPYQRASVLAFMANLSPDNVVEFSEHGASVRKPQLEFFKDFLASLPRVVEFREIAGGAFDVDRSALELAESIQDYHDKRAESGRPVSMVEAASHVLSKHKTGN